MVDITALASGSSGNCYHISDGITPLLLECGIAWRRIQRGLSFKTSELAGVLVTHEHQDHAKGLADAMRAGLDVYASRGTIDALGATGHRLHVVEARKQFQLDSWAVLPFETEHDAAEPLGYLLASTTGGKVLYATDTYYVRYRFSGLTHVMLECNYAADILAANVASGEVPVALKNRLLKSHFSLENVKEFLLANDLSAVREIWLLHLSDGNSDEQRFKREIEELTGKPVYVATRGCLR